MDKRKNAEESNAVLDNKSDGTDIRSHDRQLGYHEEMKRNTQKIITELAWMDDRRKIEESNT